jgi:hypothetical protein
LIGFPTAPVGAYAYQKAVSLVPAKQVKGKRIEPRQGSLGRKGGGRALTCDPDETVTAKAVACEHCQFALTDADQVLHGRYDSKRSV